MFYITLTLKCLAIASITGLLMGQMPHGLLTDVIGTATWVSMCVVVIRRSLVERA
jgi:hypothetical protein